MTDITDPKIKSIVEQYEKKRVKEKERYERIKETEEFKTQNSSYYYYKKIDNLETFTLNFPDKVEILKSRNIIV